MQTVRLVTCVLIGLYVNAADPGMAAEADGYGADDVFLVGAEAVRSERSGESVTGTLRVRHVYVGPTNLVGESFQAVSLIRLTGTFPASAIRPPVSIGDEGLWLLERDGAELAISKKAYGGLLWPVRRITARGTYEGYVGVAEALQRCAHATGKETVELLKQWATQGRICVSPWAVGELVKQEGKNIDVFLDDIFKDNTLPIPTRVAADKALVALREKTWVASDERFQQLKGMLRANKDDGSPRVLVAHLEMLIQRDQLDPKWFLNITSAIAGNGDDFPVRDRVWALQALHRHGRRIRDQESLFVLYAGILKEEEDATILTQAIKGVSRLALNDAQLRQLETDARGIRNIECRKLLDEALRKTGIGENGKVENGAVLGK